MNRTFFVCEKCNTIDSININPLDQKEYICTQCKHGMWHNFFTKRTYDPKKDNPDQYINTNKDELTTEF